HFPHTGSDDRRQALNYRQFLDGLLAGDRINKAINFFANYSFTLYLVHNTVMYAMWVIWSERGLLMFAVAVLLSNLVAMGLAAVGEKHHHQVARFISGRRLVKEHLQ